MWVMFSAVLVFIKPKLIVTELSISKLNYLEHRENVSKMPCDKAQPRFIHFKDLITEQQWRIYEQYVAHVS